MLRPSMICTLGILLAAPFVTSLVHAQASDTPYAPAPTQGAAPPPPSSTAPLPSAAAPTAPADSSAPLPNAPPLAPSATTTAPPAPPANTNAPPPTDAEIRAYLDRKNAEKANDRMPQIARPQIRVVTWDANIDGAWGIIFDNGQRGAWFLRGRTGVLYVHDDLFLTLGATYEIDKLYRIAGLDATNFGLQAEIMHIQYGVWLQLGGSVDSSGSASFDVATGWSLFGVEFQARNYDQLGPVMAFYGKIRIPINIMYHAFFKKDL